VVVDRLAGLFRQLELDRLSGFLLSHCRPIHRVPVWSHVIDLKRDDITPAQLTVDGEVEHSEIACAAFDLELCPDRPDMFGPEGRLLSD